MKRVVLSVLVIALIAYMANIAFAGTGKRALDFIKFNEENGNRYVVNYGADGEILSMRAADPEVYSAKRGVNNDALKSAIAFLNKNAALLNIEDVKDLKPEQIDRSENIAHVVFNHYNKGKRVLDSQISIHVNNAGEVVCVNNGLTKVGVTHGVISSNSISKDEAIKIAKEYVKTTELRGTVGASDCIFTKNNKIALSVWKVSIPSKAPLGDFVCVVNADNGGVVDSYDVMNHAKGSVYFLNPLKCKVTNEEILNLKGTNGMVGKWANVVNEDSTPAAPDANGNYVYAPEDTHFDEVNVYFHLNKIHDYYAEKFGFTGLDRSMKATVHYGDAYDNAYFSPMEGGFAFGDGSRLNDLSKEESVIYHEYTHAVTGAMVSMPYRNESGAMNEAFSDYFASALSNDPLVGEWAMAKMNKPFLRNMENNYHYPENIQHEVHYDSIVYGGALWDLRKALGGEVSDKLVHFSRNYLKGIKEQKFTDGINALIAADKEFNKGANEAKIKEVFAKRGMVVKADPSTREEVQSALKFESLNGDKEAQKLLNTMELENK